MGCEGAGVGMTVTVSVANHYRGVTAKEYFAALRDVHLQRRLHLEGMNMQSFECEDTVQVRRRVVPLPKP